jgi:basic membrane protein A
MKRTIALGLTIAAFAGLGLAQDVRVGMAFDAGGKNDRSFNQSTYEGAQKAATDFKVKVFDFEPGDPSQVGQGIRKFSEEGFDLVIGVGFANNPSITANAKEFKDTKFAVIDDVPGEGKLPNAVGLVFREHEGSYLVGYIAGSVSSTGIVGFMGGMDIPLIHKFDAGFVAGAMQAFKDRKITGGKVLSQYVGTTPAAWNDPAKAKEIGAAMAKQGADIIYAAAGASGLGIIDFVKQKQCLKAAELPSGLKFVSDVTARVAKYADYSKNCAAGTRPMFFIGVDANQNYLGDTDNNPATLNHGLSSMLKRVDVATYDTIKSVKDGSFKPGVREFGLNNNGVGYALDNYNRPLVPLAIVTKLEILKRDIIAGKIAVPDK